MIYLTRDTQPTSICDHHVVLPPDTTLRSYFSVRYEPAGRGADDREALTFDRLVMESILGSTGIPFFAIAPLTREIRAAPGVMSRVTDVLVDSGLGYLTRDEHDLESFMTQRRQFSSYEEWVFGCCTEGFNRPREARWLEKATTWNTDTFCSQIERVTCLAVYYGETGEVALWTPASAELEKVMRQCGIASVE